MTTDDHRSQMLDTLTEFIQGPNEANQLALASSNFLERLVPFFQFVSCMNLSGVIMNEDRDSVSERWSGGEVLLSLRAQHRVIMTLKSQYQATDAMHDTEQLILRFISQFPRATQEAIKAGKDVSATRVGDLFGDVADAGGEGSDLDQTLDRANEKWCAQYLQSASELVEIADEVEKSMLRLLLGLMESVCGLQDVLIAPDCHIDCHIDCHTDCH